MHILTRIANINAWPWQFLTLNQFPQASAAKERARERRRKQESELHLECLKN
jgi:hypothetical protein